jgi:hypothetical protein
MAPNTAHHHGRPSRRACQTSHEPPISAIPAAANNARDVTISHGVHANGGSDSDETLLNPAMVGALEDAIIIAQHFQENAKPVCTGAEEKTRCSGSGWRRDLSNNTTTY